LAIFAISDLHLTFEADKPMDVFGQTWENAAARLSENWRKTVAPEDAVLIPGDVSWAMYLSQAEKDFSFLNALPGRKIISKGNHDYWWETQSKLSAFAEEKGFSTISFLHNNAYLVGDTAVCGAKGYLSPRDKAKGRFTAEDEKFYNRETGRFELSLRAAQKLGAKRTVAMLHYPPNVQSAFGYLAQSYGAHTLVYGHLHGAARQKAVEGDAGGTIYKLVSADHLDFQPYKVLDD
jgi:predicted phosphohydrolase